MGIWCFLFGHNYQSILIEPHIGRFQRCTICKKKGNALCELDAEASK
jgi:hypothetical protein